MKKKIIIIGAIAVFIIIATSVAGVWAYGEAQNQLSDASDDLQTEEAITEMPSMIIDESDEMVKLWVIGNALPKDNVSICLENYNNMGVRLFMWDPITETCTGYPSFEYKPAGSSYTSYSEFIESNKDAYTCLYAGFKSYDNKITYKLLFAPVGIEEGKAKLVVFRIERHEVLSSGYDEKTGKYYEDANLETVYYDPGFEHQFHEFYCFEDLKFAYYENDKEYFEYDIKKISPMPTA